MKYYLIDTSAFVYAIEYLDRIKRNFFVEKAAGQAFLYIPQFCVPEVFNTFARFFYRDKKILGDKYTKWRSEFTKSIHDRRLIYCYDLHRYHNLNTHRVFRLEHTLPYNETNGKNAMSTLDILVVAMGIELKHLHSPNEVVVLSRDRRLIGICNADKDFARAEWFE